MTESMSFHKMIVDVIIPAYNEELSVGRVVADISQTLVREIVVVNNNSRDNTERVARNAGATVLSEKKQGYGAACLKGIAYLAAKPVPPDIIVFMDADYSDHGDQMPALIWPITQGKAEMVIGSRVLGKKEKGSMTIPQVFGNKLATTLLRWIYKCRFTDLGPYRAIRFDALMALGMKDQNYGWTVEMQLKAAKKRISYTEVPVDYRKRIGVSKVSGTVKGTVLAGYKIIMTIFRYI